MEGVREAGALILGAAPVEPLPIVGIYGVSDNRFKSYTLTQGTYPKHDEVMLGS